MHDDELLSSALGVVKKEGGHKVLAINKGRHPQLLSEFYICIFKKISTFNAYDIVFGKMFLLCPSAAPTF